MKRGAGSFGLVVLAAATAARGIRLADGIPFSKSTAPVMYGRSERAGAATQAKPPSSATKPTSPNRVALARTLSPVLRMLLGEHIINPQVSAPGGPFPGLQQLAQMDRDLLLRAVAAVGVAEVADHV